MKICVSIHIFNFVLLINDNVIPSLTNENETAQFLNLSIN